MSYTGLLNESSLLQEEHDLYFEKTTFSLPELLQEVVVELAPFTDTKAVKIKIVNNEKLPSTITSDPVRLKLVLVNIIGNALRFAQDTEMVVDVDYKNTSAHHTKLLEVTVKTKALRFAENRKELYQTKKMAKVLGGDVVLKFSTPDLGASFVASFLIEDEPLTYDTRLMH